MTVLSTAMAQPQAVSQESFFTMIFQMKWFRSGSTSRDGRIFKILSSACFLAASTAVLAGQAQPAAAKQIDASAAETAIRSARTELNAALANRDLKTTASYWHPDVSTTGGDGSLWVGYNKNVEGFAGIFKDPDFISGLRTPEKIEVANGGPKSAAETGIWEWRERVGGQVLIYCGRYLIMWDLLEENWRIRSELYVTTGLQKASPTNEPATQRSH